MLLYPLYLYDLIRVPGQPEINTETRYQSIKTQQKSLNKVCGCPVYFLRLVWVVLLLCGYVMSLWRFGPAVAGPSARALSVHSQFCVGLLWSYRCAVGLHVLCVPFVGRSDVFTSLLLVLQYLWYLMLQIRFPVMALWSLEGTRTTYF